MNSLLDNIPIQYYFRYEKKLPILYKAKPLSVQLPRITAVNISLRLADASEADRELLKTSPLLASANTSRATYVWLPLRFDGEHVLIDWLDEWRTEDYV